MKASELTADYVIVGAGAVSMAMADTLLAETSARMIIVDRRAKPGGHWNDAYPFVRLHGPSATYGVNSMPLGRGRIDAVGLNRGLHELSSGAEICAYYDRVMQERLLPSGRRPGCRGTTWTTTAWPSPWSTVSAGSSRHDAAGWTRHRPIRRCPRRMDRPSRSVSA